MKNTKVQIPSRNSELQNAITIIQAFELRTSRFASLIATISYGLFILVQKYELLSDTFTPLPIFLYFFLGIIALGAVRKGEGEALAKLDKVLIKRGMIMSTLLAHMVVQYVPGLAGLLVSISFQNIPLWGTILLSLIGIGAPQVYYQYRKRTLRTMIF